MGLQVWLPLNGTLENKGLSNITVTNNGAVVDNNGKIGKCYKFTGGNIQIPGFSFAEMKPGKKFSVALWCKGVTDGWLLACNAWEIQMRSTHISAYAGPSGGYYPAKYTANIDNDTWYHIAFTWDGDNLLLKLYIDGIFRAQNTFSTTDFSIVPFYLTWDGPRYVNDFRIYDHCLSPKEVKEISKGLVVHYTMNDLSIDYQILKYIESTGTQYINTGILMNDTVKVECEFCATEANAGLLWGTANAGNTSLTAWNYYNGMNWRFGGLAANPVPQYDPMILNHVIQDKTGLWINSDTRTNTYSGSYVFDTFPICIFGSPNDSNAESTIKLYFFKLWKDGELIRYLIPCKRKSDNEIGLYDLITNTFFENSGTGTFIAGPITNENNIIVDSSGFGNNGVINGNLSANSNSAKYNNSIYFSDGRYNYISAPISIYTDTITMSLWIRSKDGNIGYNSYHIPYCIYSSDYEMSISPAGQFRSGFVINGNRYCSDYGPNTISDKKWHMLTHTYDGNIIKRYVDGVLVNEQSVSGSLVHGTLELRLGNYFGDYYGDKELYKSDVRLYATALSSDDIKKLYNASAFIDNQGNMHALSFDDNNVQNPKILKTGVVKTNNIIETHSYLYLPAGTYINTGLVYTNDICKAVTVIRYATGGSGRDLMGYSTNASCYWGVTEAGYWEDWHPFTYTNSDITKINTITYEYQYNNTGTYQIGALTGGYSPRNKYIYNVKLYKNGALERDMWPVVENGVAGMFDMVYGVFYPVIGNGAQVGYDEENHIAKIYKHHIKGNQFIEI